MRDHWVTALPSEIEFWRGIISGTHPEPTWVSDMQQRIRGEQPFPVHLTRYLKSGAVTRILDVGSGPVTSIGRVGCPSAIDIVAVDPLADEYNKLLRQHGLTPTVQTLPAEGERISEHDLGSFDVVYSRNAIDHSYDPLQVIKQMVAVCAPGGVVFFEGYVNEATKGYGGLHQWNFMPADNGDLIVWQPDNRAFSVRSALGDRAGIRAIGNEWYTVEIHPLWNSSPIREG